MAAEYLANDLQTVSLNTPIVFSASIPCNRGCVYHEDGSGIFVLRGIVNNSCANYATYQVVYNGNIALPDGATVVPIAVAITVNGEPRLTSRAIFTPAATEDYGNVTSTAIIKVPRGCCFSVSVDAVSGVTDTTGTTEPASTIEVINSNFVVSRIA